MKKCYSLLLIFLLFTAISFGQTCPANSNPNASYQWPTHSSWFSGKSNMMSFGASGTAAPTTSVVAGAGSPYWSYESCASVSDESGNVVLTSDGVNLWDANGAAIAIPGGRLLTGTENLAGTEGSAVQGVIIVKHPLDTNRYYIFTTDDAIYGRDLGVDLGFNYFVYTKSTNTCSGATRLGTFRSTEQVAATWHANGVDVWISTHASSPNPGSATFHSFLLQCSGLNETAVTSSTGFATFSGGDHDNERASLQFNEAGTKAAQTHHCGSGNWLPAQSVEIMNFNNLTGVFSNAVGVSANNVNYSAPYDCEFSPSGNRLYVSNQCNVGAEIGYYDLTAGNAYTAVGNFPNGQSGVLKVGGDGNIYTGNFKLCGGWGYGGSIGRISAPDGTPAYNATALAVPAGTVGWGLPNMFIPPRDWLEIVDPGALTQCDLPYNFSTNWKCKATDAENTPLYENAYSMDIPCATCTIDPITGVFNSTAPGTFRIRFDICTISDTLTFTVGTCGCTADVGADAEVCEGTNVQLNPLHISSSDDGVWTVDSVPTGAGTAATITDNGTDTTFNAPVGTIPGLYKVMYTVTNGGCQDSLYIRVNKTPVVTVNDAAICAGDPAATFTATSDSTGTGYSWSDQGSGTLVTTSGTTAGNYIVQVTDNNTCISSGIGILTVNALPTVTVNDSTICTGDPVATFTATTAATVTAYLWSVNGTGGAITTTGTTAGAYTVQITDDNNCVTSGSGTLTVNTTPAPAVTAMGPYCANDAAAAMAGTPTGGAVTGVWKINDVVNVGGSFDPGTASIGNNIVRYITTENNCTDSADITVVVNANKDATLSDSIINACIFDPNPTLTVAETGGTWSDASILMVGNTATIDLAALTISQGGVVANLVITYTHAAPCGDVDQIIVSTTSALDATITQAGPYCESDNTDYTLTAVDAGGTWTGTGITDANLGTFNPSVATSVGSPFTITYTIPGNCGDSKTMDIVVDAQPDATISGESNLCINAAPITLTVPANSAAAAGTWTETPTTNGGLNQTTLVFDPATATAGTYVLDYTVVDGTCSHTDLATIIVVDTPMFTIDPIGPFCSIEASVPLTITPNVYPGGVWSSAEGGVVGTNFDPTLASTSAVNVVSYGASVTSDGQTCSATQTINVVVEEQAVVAMPADFGMCSADAATSVVAVISTPAATVGTYLASCGGCYNGTTNLFDPSTAGVGAHTITYSLGTNCSATEVTTITVTEAATLTATSPVDRCVGDVTTPSAFTATDGGAAGSGVWTLDAPAIGSIDPATGVWSGVGVTAGGTVSATYTFTTTDPAPDGCVSTQSTQMDVFDNPVVDFSRSNQDSCVAYADVFTDNSTYTLAALSGSSWDFGNGTTGTDQGSDGTSYTAAGQYTVTLSNAYANGCTGTASLVVEVFPLPAADFAWSPTIPNVLDPSILFVNYSQGDAAATDIGYQWDFTTQGFPATSTITEPNVVYTVVGDDTIPVSLIVTDNFLTTQGANVSCTDTIIKNVIVQDIFQLFVPNAFTPGKKPDGLNDTFKPVGKNWSPDKFEFVVLDRWGNLIFSTTTIGDSWDGTVQGGASGGLAQNDVYVWKITVANIYTGKVHKRAGTVTLVK